MRPLGYWIQGQEGNTLFAHDTHRGHTQGLGADAVLEVVGAGPALRLAYDILRPGGIISSVGCHTGKLV